MEPPRRRGKVACADQTIQPDGITPAWAGKRLSPVTPYNPPSDHPRMGGEKTYCFQINHLHDRDHPRVGGEKRFGDRSCRFVEGSPPRGRGKAAGEGPAVCAAGITPAWAGKRQWQRCPGQCRVRITPAWAGKRSVVQLMCFDTAKDHPRVGGEKARPSNPCCKPRWDHPRVGGEKMS